MTCKEPEWNVARKKKVFNMFFVFARCLALCSQTFLLAVRFAIKATSDRLHQHVITSSKSLLWILLAFGTKLMDVKKIEARQPLLLKLSFYQLGWLEQIISSYSTRLRLAVHFVLNCRLSSSLVMQTKPLLNWKIYCVNVLYSIVLQIKSMDCSC